MDNLLLCETCGHSVVGHSGSGCSACPCVRSKEAAIELGLDAARREIRGLWVGEADERGTKLA